MNKEVEMSVLDWLFLALRFAVAAVFISYGIGKLQNVKGFTVTLRRYKFLSPKAGVYLARVIPPVEILLGALLLLNIMPVTVAFVLVVLLLVFSGALVYSQLTSKAAAKDCGCGGTRPVSYKDALIRNSVLTFALVSIICGAVFTELAQSLLLTTLQTVLLLLVIARSVAFQSSKFQHLLAIAGGSHAAKHSAESGSEQGITTATGRRTFDNVWKHKGIG
jgi:DoxX